ncbi:MAG: relaxase/mobilization nuclease domain-containing protein [Gammaproteobacteria bacterium]|nr:relaxase/mobilization nuclease domain-containing protein [Gammaproteobacteria bacterium]
MIAKHVPMRAAQKSDFAGLVDYITDAQSKEHRLGAVTVTNCETENIKAATAEILATQQGNTRATSDKTYHLLLSFRAGEQPPLETLKIIEARICAGIGFADHQRVSAIHNDTDNLHIHIAINKIHPTRGTMQEPYKAYKALGELCEILEKEFGLQADNHKAVKTLSEGKAADMERHAGIESLVSWIKTECLPEMRSATTWVQLHEVMAASGLEIKERGAGLVIEAGGVQVKASTIARDFSKPALEARLGSFVGDANEASVNKPKRQYQKKPLKQKINTAELYAKYKQEQSSHAEIRTAELAKLRHKKDRVIADAKRANNLHRKTIGILDTNGINRKFLYSQASASLKASIKDANEDYSKKREKVIQTYQRRTWADWLKNEAVSGDDKALTALRAREGAGLQGNTIRPDENKQRKTANLSVDNITKKGTVIYRSDAGAIRDDGSKLQVSNNATTAGIEAAIKLAMERYGNKITITGTAEFKAQVISVAAKSNLPITFADSGLERLRLNYLEKINDRSREQPAGRNDGRRLDSSSDGAARQRTATNNNGHAIASGGGLRGTGLQQRNSKPNIARVGRKPPPVNQNRLRRLSQLGVVQLTSRSEMLLQGDVPRNVEHQGAKRDNGLRWNGIGSGIKSDHVAAAKKYIAERVEKRLKGFDIPKHSIYNGEAQAAKFAGLRNIDGYPMALLKMDDESISVLPIDKATAQRLTKVSLDQEVSVTDKGSIKTSKGRSR